jgi:ankyrin repeat protein
MFNHVAVVELLIKNGADVNTLSTTPEHWTPATFAANAGHVEVLQILLSHGADPKIAPGNGVTTLGQAMKGGHQTTVEILLEALGGPEYPKDTVALQMAIAQSHAAMSSLMTTVSIMYRYINPKHIGSEKLGWVKWVLDQGGELLRSRAMVNMLRAAISHDDVSMATELLNLGADSNTIFDSGYTPLHVAVSRRNMDLIKLLLEAGADPAKPTQDPKGLKLTPLHQAIMDWKDGSIKAISVINLLLASRRCRVMEGEELESTAFASVVRQLNHCNDEVASQADELVHSMIGSTNVNDDRSDDRSTLMHVAFHYKQKELIDTLQCAGADINSRNNNNLDGPTPLLAACQSDVEEVKFLIKRGADVSVVSNHGEGLLQLAAGRGQVEVLKFLLDLDRADEEPLDIDAVDEAGHTPLTSATSANREEAALFLLERGASTKCRTSDGQYAIHYAIQNNMQRAIDKILEDNSIDNVNIEDDKRWTPLALACIHSAPTVVTKLLSLGADPHIANHKTGDQPLHIALKRPREWPPADEKCSGRALDLINHKGIDLTARDASGSTPLHLASERHHLLVTKLLLSKGLSPHCEDNRGRTPLCLCSEPDIAQALIDHGADVNHSDENGWTPLHYAVSRCWVKAFAVLREAGADMEARTRNDGLSVKERLAKFGTFENWVNKEREIFNVYDDELREEWVKYAGM